VYSNVVGFIKVDTPAGYSMVSNPLVPLDETATFQDTLGKYLGVDAPGATAAGDPAISDNIISYDASTGNFIRWWLVGGAGIPAEYVGKWVDAGLNIVADSPQPGDGFWVLRQSNTEAVLLGGVPDAAQTTLELPPGYSIFSYPYPVAQRLNPEDPEPNFWATAGARGGQDPGDADNIIEWTGTDFVKYWYVDYPQTPFDQKWVDASTTVTDKVFEPGKAYWYFNSATTTLSLTLTKPY
jgi:hypothetical protein